MAPFCRGDLASHAQIHNAVLDNEHADIDLSSSIVLEQRYLVPDSVLRYPIKGFPNLPPVDFSTVQFGNSKFVEISREANAPSRPISLQGLLATLSPRKVATRTGLRLRSYRRARQSWCLITNRREGLLYRRLPRSIHNRIYATGNPLRHRLKRLRLSKQSPQVKALERQPAHASVPVLNLTSPSVVYLPLSRQTPSVRTVRRYKFVSVGDIYLTPLNDHLEFLLENSKKRDDYARFVGAQSKRKRKSHLFFRKYPLTDPFVDRAPLLSRRQLETVNVLAPSSSGVGEKTVLFSQFADLGVQYTDAFESECCEESIQDPSAVSLEEKIVTPSSAEADIESNQVDKVSRQLATLSVSSTSRDVTSENVNSNHGCIEYLPSVLEDTVASLIEAIVVTDSFTYPSQGTNSLQTSSVSSNPNDGLNLFRRPVGAFDFSGNNNLFVGFARVPESCFASSPSTQAISSAADSASFSEQLIQARQALRPTQTSSDLPISPERALQTSNAQLLASSLLTERGQVTNTSSGTPQLVIPSSTSVQSLAAKFEHCDDTSDRPFDGALFAPITTIQETEFTRFKDSSNDQSSLGETPITSVLSDPSNSPAAQENICVSAGPSSIHPPSSCQGINQESSNFIPDNHGRSCEYLEVAKGEKLTDTSAYHERHASSIYIESEETTASSPPPPEAYVGFPSNPWRGPPPVLDPAEEAHVPEPIILPPANQPYSPNSPVVPDPYHPWKYPGDPFENPPQNREFCWKLSEKNLLGEAGPSTERSRESLEAIYEIRHRIEQDQQRKAREKQRQQQRAIKNAQEADLPTHNRVTDSSYQQVPDSSDPINLPHHESCNSLQSEKEFITTHTLSSTPSPVLPTEFIPEQVATYLEHSSTPSAQELPHPEGSQRIFRSHQDLQISTQFHKTWISPWNPRPTDLEIPLNTKSSFPTDRGSLKVSADRTFSNLDSGIDTEDNDRDFESQPSFVQDTESTYFSGAVSPLSLGSPVQTFASSTVSSNRCTVWPRLDPPTTPFNLDQPSTSPDSCLSPKRRQRTRDKFRDLLSGSKKKSVDQDSEINNETIKGLTSLLRRNKLSKDSNSDSHHTGFNPQGNNSTDLVSDDCESPCSVPSNSGPPLPVFGRQRSKTSVGSKPSSGYKDQDQFLSQLGSKFHPSPEITYPTTVGDWGLPERLNLKSHTPKQISLPRVEYISLQGPQLARAFDLPLSASFSPVDSAISFSDSTNPLIPSSRSIIPSYHGSSHSNILSAASEMDKLQVRPSDFSSVKSKAVEDARNMQNFVMNEANKLGQAPPKYVLLELIGKGSFGRVYKAKDLASAAMVAVKIINIDESDHAELGQVDTFGDFMKEVNALKRLKEQKAKNINNVIDAFPMGHSMWMITEHCGGGSVATLMRPTAPGGLQEKWIIPIFREVAIAVSWVHQAGIIHRDLKCANVLVTEDGGVQLCDFGVAGIVETRLDKRSTMIGTPHWMAPELFGPKPKYGKEVDIWALGCLVFEMATGLPPNVSNNISIANLATHLQHHTPRLVGDQYSPELKDIVAFCLEELPSARPSIEEVVKHPYILNTEETHPTSTLVDLVRAFKLWEDHGGSRRSLFIMGGAQGPKPSDFTPYEDEWNFSTTAAFDQEVSRDSNPQDVYNAYGVGVMDFGEQTSRPTPQKPSRRRPPPEALNPLPIPLQKLFDSNTLTNYRDVSREQYGRGPPPPTDDRSQTSSQATRPRPTSDLPLRDDTAQASIRDNMIDLGGHDAETGISFFPGDTIKADRRPSQAEENDEYGPLHDFSKPALSDPADMNPNRRTQDWKFPTMMPPASADPEVSRFPNTYEPPLPAITPASGGRPALVHHPTEPIGNFNPFLNDRMSLIDLDAAAAGRMSLIDLDAADVGSHVPEITRPSTANSDVGSAASEYAPSGNPFELERHASMYMSDFSASDAETSSRANGHDYGSDSDYVSMAPPASRRDLQPPTSVPLHSSGGGLDSIPPLQAPPSVAAMSGTASVEEMEREFEKQFGALQVQLGSFRESFVAYEAARKGGKQIGGA